MQQTVITVISAQPNTLTSSLVDKIAADIQRLGVDRIEIEALATGKAVDFVINVDHPELSKRIYSIFSNRQDCDVFIQPQGANRKKRLLLADMDATMVVGETLDELAGHLGLKDKVSAITEKAMRGELDFEQALRERVGMLKGLALSSVFEVVRSVQLSQGSQSLVKTMKRHGAHCVLVSGGFDFFTQHVASLCGFDINIGNRLGVEGDKLTGDVGLPIIDKHYKKKTLQSETARLGLTPDLTLAVGDGANDIPMLQAAGVGVGYFAKSAVVAATPFQIRYTDLTSILYMQGYKKAEIVI